MRALPCIQIGGQSATPFKYNYSLATPAASKFPLKVQDRAQAIARIERNPLDTALGLHEGFEGLAVREARLQ